MLPSAALANCLPYDIGTIPLKQQFGETKKSWGLVNKDLLELWVNEETGTWTIVLQTSDGMACYVASGDHWMPYLKEDSM